MNKFTSIIIVNWNGFKYLKNALNSIYRHNTSIPFELIIVDNGSNDGSVQYIQNFKKNRPEIKLICNTENKGFSIANNQGIRIATGKYILLLNNDILVKGNNWLEPMINFLENNPLAGIVGPRCGKLDKAMTFIEHYLPNYVGPVDYVEGWCFLMRKSLAEKINLCRSKLWKMSKGYLCEDMFLFAEDSEFCQRSKLLGHECYQINNVPIHHFGSSTAKIQVKENPKASFDFRDVSHESTQKLRNMIPKKYNVNPNNKKFLIVRANARGDILNTTPAVNALRHKYPNAFIGYLCFQASQDVLALNYDIDYVYTIPETATLETFALPLLIPWTEVFYLGDHIYPSMEILLKALKKKKFSIKSGHELMDSQDISVRKKRGDAKKPYSQIFAEMMNVELQQEKVIHNTTSKSENEAVLKLSHLNNDNKKIIALCLDSHWPTRTYPINKRKDLIDLLLKNYNIVLVGMNQFRHMFPPETHNLLNLINQTNFEQLCAILKKVDMIVTVDTATLHIGLAFEKPIVSLWNITEPYHVMSYQPKNHVHLITNTACGPCYQVNCEKNNYACYDQLFSERIADAIFYLDK